MHYKTIIENYQPQTELEEKTKQVMLDSIAQEGDAILSRDNLLAHITVSGFIINENKTKTLMVHHNIYNSWGWTGGHADGERDLFKVALKEAKEETGVEHFVPFSSMPISLEIIPVYPHRKNGAWVTTHLHLNITFVLVADEQENLRIKYDENSGVAWLPINALGDYVTEPEMLIHYNELIRRINLNQ